MHRLQWKVLAGYLLVTAIGLGVAGWLALAELKSRDMTQLQAQLTAQARFAGEIFAGPLSQAELDMQKIDALADRLGEAIGARLTVIAADGKVWGDSYESGESLRRMDNHLSRPEVREALASGLGVSIRFSDTVRIRMLNVAIAVRTRSPGSRLLGFLRLSLPLTAIESQHRALQNALAAALGGAFLLSLALSYLIARGVTRPLAEMVSAAEHMARGEFHPRLRPRSRDEVADLAGVLNRMAASIEETIASLKEDRAKMAATLTAMQEGVMVLAADGTIRLTNPALQRMLGRQEEGLMNRPYLEIIRQPRLTEFITKALSGQGSLETEIALGSGPIRIFQVRASALLPDPERGIELVLVFHDITDLRRLEEVRKDFVANVSHELRTPLTAIKGYVEALQDSVDDPGQRAKFLEVIQKHVDRLNLIITDLLLLSHIESGQIPIKLEPLDISALLDRTVALLGQLIKRKQHRMLMEVAPGLLPVSGDEERLGQVFSNLLDNAIKYTPDGGTITVTAREDGSTMEVGIADTGVGIPPKDLPRIFERFYRVDKARSRELGGTGLGLAIVKHLVEGHGGTVSAESSGKGSIFRVRLPLAARDTR